MKKLNCLVCKATVMVDQNAITGEIVECPSCGQEHEVQLLNEVVSIELAPEIEETWGE